MNHFFTRLQRSLLSAGPRGSSQFVGRWSKRPASRRLIFERLEERTLLASFSNPAPITINDDAAATPYPSNIVVSGFPIGSTIDKVTVTIHNFSHTFPDDVDVLLVGPTGVNAIIWSDVGGSFDVLAANMVTITLDDAVGSPLPDNAQLMPGTFQPTDVGVGDAFPAPAPAPSGFQVLSAFNGTDPNGTWSLYVVDDASPDSGAIAGGWSLNIATEPAANLSIAKTANKDVVLAGEELIYNIVVQNDGPNTALNVVVTDTLPAGVAFLGDTAITSPPGGCTAAAGDPTVLTCNIGNIPAGADRDFQIKIKVPPEFVAMEADGTRTIINTATVSSVSDSDASDNTVTEATFVEELANLVITKFVEPSDIVFAGDLITYTIWVDNLGPSAARNVVINDTLLNSAQVEVQSCAFSVSQGGGAITQFTCDTGTVVGTQFGSGIGTFSANFLVPVTAYADPMSQTTTGRLRASFRLLVNGVVDNANDETFNMTLTNTTRVTSNTPDPVSSNNFVTADIRVINDADLRVTKVSKPDDTVRAGEPITYTITVDNLGPVDARNVVFTDLTLSDQDFQVVTVVDDPNRTDSCVIIPGFGALTKSSTIKCSLTDPLEAVGSETNPPVQNSGRWIVQVVVQSDLASDIDNTVSVFTEFREVDLPPVGGSLEDVPGTPDSDKSNNLATDTITVLAVSDLALAVLATAEEQQTAQAGLMFNNAVFGQAFPTAPNYFASTRVTAGRRIQYTLNITNNGPSPAENVVVSDLLPAGVRIYQGSLTASQGTCDGGTPGQPLDRLTCGLGTLADAGTATITFQVVTDASIPAGDVLVNEASVTSTSEDFDNSDNQARAEHTVLAAADLSLTKTSVGENVTGFNAALDRLIENDVAGAVTAGKVLRYEITVQNNGPSDSQNVTISDALPSTPLPGPVTFLSADGADCRPDAVDNDTLFCGLGTLAAGERRTFDIYVFVDPSVPATTVLANCATALTGASNTAPPGAPPTLPTGGPTQTLTWDPLTTNNSNVCTNTTVNTSADLAITKSAVLPKLFPGDEVRFHIRVENLGPSAATNVIVTDTLPLGIEFEFDTDNCVLVGPAAPPDVVECSLGTMQPGEVIEFDIWGEVTAATPSGTELCNTAVVASTVPPSPATTDFNTSNNTAIACFFTVPGADLSVTKTGPATINPGTNITYTITVSNGGPTAAIDTVLEDFIPAGERTLSVTPSTGSCLAGVSGDADRPTTCNLGIIQAGASVEITVVVEADNCLHDLDELFNDVVVRSDTFDQNNANNVFHSTTEVRQSANGNVTAAARRGSLTIQGDNFNNTFTIDTPTEALPHALRITPFGGTLVNGECRSVQVHGVKGNVAIRMGRANDTVNFDGPISLRRALNIYMGQGNDTVRLSNVNVKGITSIRVDGDHDVVSVIDSVLGSLSIRTGRVNDSVLVDGTHVLGTTSIRSDGSIDMVRIVDSIFDDDTLVQGGRGSDTLDIGILSSPNANGNDFNGALTVRGFENVIS